MYSSVCVLRENGVLLLVAARDEVGADAAAENGGLHFGGVCQAL